MDIEQVARVVKLVERSQLHEMTIANNGQSITVVNNVASQNSSHPTEVTPTHETKETSNVALEVCATYVGNVYLSEDDTTENLVHEGDSIEKGQTICFIEELTRLLPVISDKAGIVDTILVKNGQNIEYGQPILKLKSSTYSQSTIK
ncbi:acetyl-CoA carboxylase biotin carboxyl carrier protein [Psychrobacter alimentarius]|uniref:acetyl-CoA carboxylase biotin carboxyl carrier protein n=1 Tax=Psychrobacter alimentarius TaxID=261164 RepID=UPI00191B2715|nr:biotin/lipoyl-containing protein [Psychrobacter alimentarius]